MLNYRATNWDSVVSLIEKISSCKSHLFSLSSVFFLEKAGTFGIGRASLLITF